MINQENIHDKGLMVLKYKKMLQISMKKRTNKNTGNKEAKIYRKKIQTHTYLIQTYCIKDMQN